MEERAKQWRINSPSSQNSTVAVMMSKGEVVNSTKTERDGDGAHIVLTKQLADNWMSRELMTPLFQTKREEMERHGRKEGGGGGVGQ
jgi:hypothetical protein